MIPRRFTGRVGLLALLAGGVWMASCGEVNVTTVEVGTLEVTPTAVELIPGESARLRVRVMAADGSDLEGRTVAWTSLDAEVATVSSSGMVTAVAPGRTTIRAMAEGVSGSAEVTVGPGPRIALSEEGVTLTGMSGSPEEHGAAVTISNSGGGALGGLDVSITYDSGETGWLDASLGSTAAPAELALTATASELGAGTLTAEVAVSSLSASNSPQTVAVTFEVAEAEPRLRIPSPVGITVTEGLPPPPPDSLPVTNAGGGEITGLEAEVEYEEGGSEAWLSASLGSDTAPTELVLSVDVEDLPVDVYVAAVIVSSPDAVNSPVTVDVTLTVGDPPPEIDLSESSVEFRAFHEAADPDSRDVEITNAGGKPLTDLEASVSYGSGESEWLSLELSATEAPATLTLSPETGDLPPGTHEATVSVASEVADNSPQTVAVTFRVRPRADLVVSKTASPSLVEAGGRVTYTVTVRNAGPSDATGVTVEEEPSGPLTFVSANPSGEYDPGTGIWSVGSLAASGPAATLTLVFDVGDGAQAPLENVVRVSSDVRDHRPNNDEDEVTTPVAPPKAPSDLTATAVSPSQIDLDWTDNSTNEAEFEIQRSTTGGAPWTTVATRPADATGFSDTGLDDATTYTYRVRARNEPAGPSDFSNEASATTPLGPPSAPSNLTATLHPPSRIDLTWSDDSDSEDDFEIQRSDDDGATWTTVTTRPDGSESYSDKGLEDGTRYTYRVRSRNAAGNSDWSNEASATTPLPAPSKLEATAVSASRIELTWKDNSDNESEFELQRQTGGGGWVTVVRTAADVTSYSDTGREDGTTYTYRVRARNAVTESGFSNEADATTLPGVPNAPQLLSADAVSSSQIDLAWADNSDNEDDFELQRSPGSGGSWTTVATLGANTTGFSDNGREDGSTYTYRVRARNLGGDSAWSNEESATTTLPAPSGLSAEAVSSSRIDLTWNDNSDNESGFEVQRSGNGGGSWTTAVTTGADVESFSDTGRDDATTYTYRVRAVNAEIASDFSSLASATTPLAPPSAPSGLTASPSSPNAVDLSWTDNSDSEDGFELQRSGNGGGSWTTVATPGPDATSHSDAGLGDGTTYTYRVRARNTAGESAWSNQASATTPLPSPSGLSATAFSPSQVDLDWTDNSSNESGFEVQRSTNGGATWTVAATTAAGATGFSDTGLQENTTYTYRVRAVNAVIASGFSNDASATTPLPPPPAAPSGLSATVDFSGEVELSWTDNSDNEADFEIQRSDDDDGTWTTIATPAANTTSFSDTTAEEGTPYTYRVRARNSGGVSDWSNEASTATE